MTAASRFVVFAVALACFTRAHGGNSGGTTAFLALSGVSVPEIPARAAELVAAAGATDRGRTAGEVIRAVSNIAGPGVLPYTVSAICRKNPESAGPAVASAVGLQPRDVLAFTKAALCAAPEQVEQVVFSASSAVPGLGASVAIVACQQLPAASEGIRAGLVKARPDMELYLEEAESKQGTNNYQTVIKRAAQLSDEAARARTR